MLEALKVPIESQVAVFSKTSLQADLIEPRNPRTIFFNDSVAVAWMHGGFIELASHDPQRGVIFYTLVQQDTYKPRFQRRDDCLRCHISPASLDVPGMIIRSAFTASDGTPRMILGSSVIDHRSPIEDRWGGYYVTGASGAVRHMGNAFVTNEDHPMSMVSDATLRLSSLERKFDPRNYLSPYSDVSALMVFDHQMYMNSLITRVGWEIRAALYKGGQARVFDLATLLRETAEEFVDYLFFIEEAPLSAAIIDDTSGSPKGPTSKFVERFAAQGPRDGKGRSLRDLDLKHRLLRYPCSYMIYSDAFEALPAEARNAIYKRMWQVLSGAVQEKKYARLTLADRRAIVEILRETKKDLPDYFLPLK